jgi:hypothetical protein
MLTCADVCFRPTRKTRTSATETRAQTRIVRRSLLMQREEVGGEEKAEEEVVEGEGGTHEPQRGILRTIGPRERAKMQQVALLVQNYLLYSHKMTCLLVQKYLLDGTRVRILTQLQMQRFQAALTRTLWLLLTIWKKTGKECW